MDIPINAKVNCSDGPCGRSTHLILMPTTEQITHLVVSDESFPETTRYLVPIVHVIDSTSGSIQLKCSREELSQMPIFDQMQFIPSDVSGFSGTPYMKWPYYAPEPVFIRVEKERIPANELLIRRGSSVEATNGRVGHVDEFLINPEDDTITHLVLREGHLWGQKDVSIPVSQIDHYQKNTVYLKLDKQAIEALPAIAIRRTKQNK